MHKIFHITIFIVFFCIVLGGAPVAQDKINIPRPTKRLYIAPTKGEIAPKNFSILHISIGEQTLNDVIDIFGEGRIFKCGENKPFTVCYTSDKESDDTTIIFDSYITCGDAPKKVKSFFVGQKNFLNLCNNECFKSKFVDKSIATKSGISLSMSKNDFFKLLGQPTKISEDVILYYYEKKEKMSEELHNQLQEIDQKIFGQNYNTSPYYFITARIEAYFKNEKLFWFYIQKFESS